MMERILVPLDGSPVAEAVLPVAELLAQNWDAELILLRAVALKEEFQDQAPEVRMAATSEVIGYLGTLAAGLTKRGVKTRWTLSHDEPLAAITEAVTREQINLIAMATHGRSGLRRLLLGSVAAGVVRLAQIPVLLVRGLRTGTPWH